MISDSDRGLFLSEDNDSVQGFFWTDKPYHAKFFFSFNSAKSFLHEMSVKTPNTNYLIHSFQNIQLKVEYKLDKSDDYHKDRKILKEKQIREQIELEEKYGVDCHG